MTNKDTMERLFKDLENHEFPLNKWSAGDIEELEQQKGIKLPESYKLLLMQCGSGDLPFARLYSADEIREIMQAESDLEDQQWIPFGDDYSGEYYCFDVSKDLVDGECRILSIISGCDREIDFECPDFPSFVKDSMIEMGEWT